MSFEMKKTSRFVVLLLTVTMIFTGFCVPGAGASAVYAVESDSYEVTQVPVTNVVIDGELKVGKTVKAVATGTNNKTATNVIYEWQCEDIQYDEYGDEEVVYKSISDVTTDTLKIPYSMKGKKICVIAKGDNDSKAKSEVSDEIAADTSPDGVELEKILKSYLYGVLKPEFGTDENIVSYLDKQIKEKGYEGVNVTLKSSSKPDIIANNGIITYYYRDIDNENKDKMIQPELVFTLSKGESTVELKKKANINWDIEKLKVDLNKYILSNVNEEDLKSKNIDLNNVKSDLILPTRVNDKKYATLYWESSDPDILQIINEGSAWEPAYKAIVKASTEDKNVTLIAKVDYTFTNDDKEKVAISQLKKEFPITVKASSINVQQEMQKQLDTNYTINKIKYSITNEVIDSTNVTGDIKFLSAGNTGIANSDDYKFSVTSSDPEVLKVNGYRGIIYRPLPGESDKNVTFTVTMTQKSGSFSASKDFLITVKPLAQAEIDKEIKLMEKVKASYFEGIKGKNKSKDSILTNMHAFREVSLAEDGETLEWVYNFKDDKEKGIEPVELPGYDPMGSAAWRLFRSSRADIIKDENLLLYQPKYNTELTIDSMLSSIEYGKYAEKYKDNKYFQKLVNQPVSVVVTVPGKEGENPNKNVEAKKVKVFTSLYDGRSSIFPVPYGEIEVTSGLARSYGYTNANIEKHAANNEVTMFDALVAMHARAMGINSPKEDKAVETIKGILTIGDTGFLTKVMTEDAPVSFMLNGRMPNDSVYNEQYKGYNGYTVDNAVIKNNDILSYFFYQDSAYGDYYSWFEENGTAIRDLTVLKDEMCTLNLKGFMAMHFGCSTEQKILQMTTALDGIQLVFCDQAGTFTDIEGAVTSNVKVNFAIEKPGEYIISAKGNGKTPLIAPYLKVKVVENGIDINPNPDTNIDPDTKPGTEVGTDKDTNTNTDPEIAKELMKNIATEYAGKDVEWWGGKDTSKFWHTVGVGAYKNFNPKTEIVISKDAKQAFVNKMIALANEGSEKAYYNANIQANAINGLSAMGYDASQLWTVNHSKISAIDNLKAINLKEAKEGWYKTIAPYAITAFRQGNYNTEIQENAHIEYLKEQLALDSNWDWGVDTPAMIMQGLTPYYCREDIKTAIDTAIVKLSEKQGLDGSFGNANADAMVIITLAQLGINPKTDERFVKGENSLLDGLLLYRTADNRGFSFNHKEWNDTATYQGLLGLIAATKVMDSGKAYNIYDFSKSAKVAAYANGTIVDTDEKTIEQPVGDKNINITFTLKADKGTWIPATTVKLKKDSTVYHAFIKVLDDAGFTYVGAENNYVSSITNKNGTTLAEFTNGSNSGWVYSVNNLIPNKGLREYKLNDGDKIIWYYTNNWAKDPDIVKAAGGRAAVEKYTKDSMEGKVEAEAKADKNGVASVKLSDKDISSAIKETLENAQESKKNITKKVFIEIKADSKATKVETIIPKVSVTELSKKIDEVILNSAIANVRFDNVTLGKIADDIKDDLKVTTEKVDIKNSNILTDKISKENQTKLVNMIGDRPVYDFTIQSGNEKISKFAGKVKVSLSYKLINNEKPEGIVIYYINEDGALKKIPGAKYSNENVQFETTHFSYYSVGYESPLNYKDVKSGAWYEEAVNYAVQNSIMNGVSLTEFKPNDKTTRAMLATILYNMEGKQATKIESGFQDVKKDVWYEMPVNWATEKEIVKGISEKSFNPEGNVTREQVAVMLYNYAKFKNIEVKVKSAAIETMTDSDKISLWAKDAMIWAFNKKIINGKGNNILDPKGNATRAEISQMVKNFIENK